MRTKTISGQVMPGLILSAVAVFLLLNTFTGSRFDQQLVAMSGIWALTVIGYQLTFGHLGSLNLAHGAFFGIGAYASAIMAQRFGLDFSLTLPLAIVVASAAAALVALPVFRLKSHYFALATLAVAQLVHLVAVNWQPVTGGANGLAGVPPLIVLGTRVASGLPQILLIWALVGAAGLLVVKFVSGKSGLALAALRETPTAAGTLGINRGGYQMMALALGAALAATAGALQVHVLRVVSPDVTHFSVLVVCLTMTVLGGRRSVVGAVTAAVLLTHLPEWVRGFESYYLVLNGVILLIAIIFAPDGLMGLAQSLQQKFAWFRPIQKLPLRSASDIASPALRAGDAGLTVSALEKSFGGLRALDNIDLRLAPGEIVGIIGPNGSGKTTLINVISGLVAADGGRILLGVGEVTNQPADVIARAGIARTFQTPDLPSESSIIDAVSVAADRTTALAALAAIDSWEDLNQLCRDLPHGRRRLVEVARAVATGANVLMLDEPAAGLSELEAVRLAETLRRLADGGRAVLIIDHQMEFLLPICDRLICFEQGRVIADDLPATVIDDPAVRTAYFGVSA